MPNIITILNIIVCYNEWYQTSVDMRNEKNKITDITKEVATLLSLRFIACCESRVVRRALTGVAAPPSLRLARYSHARRFRPHSVLRQLEFVRRSLRCRSAGCTWLFPESAKLFFEVCKVTVKGIALAFLCIILCEKRCFCCDLGKC